MKQILYAAMAGYARKGLNSESYLTHSDDDAIFSVITVQQKGHGSFISLLVRIVGESIIVEEDRNDKPLVDALVQAGISRRQIILAYAGEPVPAQA